MRMSGFSWLVQRPAAAGDPLTLSSQTKATPFRIILWRCWAPSEHGSAHRNCASYWADAGSAVTVPDNRCTNVGYPHDSRPGQSLARSLSLTLSGRLPNAEPNGPNGDKRRSALTRLEAVGRRARGQRIEREPVF